MPSIALRGDYTAEPVRGIAARARDADQARRLLSIAAVYDGMSRADAARIGRRCATGCTGSTTRVRTA